MPLPKDCSECAFFDTKTSQCRRHAPGTAREEFELAHWPTVSRSFRCGSGLQVGDGSEAPVPCQFCLHWLQPGGKGLDPEYLHDFPAAWWQRSGYCTRYAPTPSSEPERRAFHLVSHAQDRCGDGEDVR